MLEQDGHCRSLASPGIFNTILSIVILIGILISYLPQHYRILERRSSLGISMYFILLGMISTTCALLNITLLPRSWEDVRCCREINGLACFAGLLGLAQVGMQWACFWFIHFLFAKFQTRPSRNATLASSSLAILTCLVPLIFIPTALFLPTYGRALFAYALGILAAIAASLQYFPQLYTTFVLKRVESLSIPMMCVQTPGSFVWVASLMARLGWEGWSTWGSFLVTACLQGSLLVMAIYYEVGRSRKTAEESASEDDSQTDDNRNDLGEREPLL